jgi:hypothetical protein
MSPTIKIKILQAAGYIREEGNLIDAEEFFFGFRVLNWVAGRDDPAAIEKYLILLKYYKQGKVEIQFDEEGSLQFREKELFGAREKGKKGKEGEEATESGAD